MGFFSGLLKAVGFVGGIIAAPFTGGASLLLTAGIGASTLSGGGGNGLFNIKRTLTNASPTGGNQIQRVLLGNKPADPPPLNYKGEIPVYTARNITPTEKKDVTLYGNYSDINYLTIPVDNDTSNIKVVPNTYFPYIVTFTNHPPSNGIRYISEFVYKKLGADWDTNFL